MPSLPALAAPDGPARLDDHPDHRRQLLVVASPADGPAAVVVQVVTHPARGVRHQAVAVADPTGWTAAQIAGRGAAPPVFDTSVGPHDAVQVTGGLDALGVSVDLRLEAVTPGHTEDHRVLRDDTGTLLVAEDRHSRWGRARGRIILPGVDRSLHAEPAVVVRRAGIVPSDLPPGGVPDTLPQRWWLTLHGRLDEHWMALTLDQGPDGWTLHEAGTWGRGLGAAAPLARVDVDVAWFPGRRTPRRVAVSAHVRDREPLEVVWEHRVGLPGAALGGLGAAWPLGGSTTGAAVEQGTADPTDPLAAAHVLAVGALASPDPSVEGTGVLELVAVGPHTATGLPGFLEGPP